MLEGTIPLEKGREQIIQEIVTFLAINGGIVPGTISEFWYQVALSFNVKPDESVLTTAREVLKSLNEEWDEDYVDENASAPSLEAYETLYEHVRTMPLRDEGERGQLLPEVEGEDEEDDNIGSLKEEVAFQTERTNSEIDSVLNQIGRQDLILNPDWQRSFVWKLKKQRRLVESILLGLPIPSLLLFREPKTGARYVIDGRQRLETIARFRASKPKKGEDPVRPRFKTFPRSVEGWRDGEALHSAAGKYYDDLPVAWKAKFDQAALQLHTFINLPLDKLYQIFKRYNTGAEQLRAAEVRNAVYQASPLHAMMYRIAGEHGSESKFASEEERRVAATLTAIMKNKKARYGRYDFVGRYFAFSYMKTGSVANATNEFMAQYETADIDALCDEFVRIFNTSRDWYEYFLTTPSDDGKFHAFLATIQLVSTRHMLLNHVDVGSARTGDVKAHVRAKWEGFANSTLEDKQNSSTFRERQRAWIQELEAVCCAKPVE